jgi:membrane protease YdiL (CAAX protease family)
MGIYIEAFILYVVLFFSGSAGTGTGGAGGFSISAQLTRILLYCLPSLALIWYLLIRTKRLKAWNIRPGRRDFISGLIALPCLLIIGFLTAFVSSYIGGESAQVLLKAPSTAAEWVILCIYCISAAYLEESYFRFYILSRKKELKLNSLSALAVSTALFSICHIYEGPWGFLNSILSGTLLAFIFLRYKSLHGIAVAHSLYNISVYAINALAQNS